MSKSPNYPAMSLPNAVGGCKRIWDKHERTILSEGEIAAAMGFDSLSGPTRTKLSALKKYGLLEKAASGWKLSDRAVQIMVHPPDSREYQGAVLKAAHANKILSELIKSHFGSSQEVISSYLIANKGFTTSGAKVLVKSFMETKSFVSMMIRGTIPKDAENGDGTTPDPETPPKPKNETMTANPGQIAASITLFGDGDFQVVAPEKITPANKPLVVAWLRGLLGQLGVSDIKDNELDPGDGSTDEQRASPA